MTTRRALLVEVQPQQSRTRPHAKKRTRDSDSSSESSDESDFDFKGGYHDHRAWNEKTFMNNIALGTGVFFFLEKRPGMIAFSFLFRTLV